MSFRKINNVLVSLLLLNLITRGYGIWFQKIGWDEEQFYYGGKGLLRFFYDLFIHGQQDNISADIISIYGPAGKYLSAIGLLIYEGWVSLSGINDLFASYTIVRVCSSLIPSLISVWLLYKISQKLSDNHWFHYSVIFIAAFAFRWVESSHYATPDSILTMSVLLAIKETICLQSQYQRKTLIWLGFAIAIAISAKINVGILLWGVVNLYILLSRSRQFTRERFLYIIQLNLVFTGFSLILLWPYLIYWSEYLHKVDFHIYSFPYIIEGHPWIYFIFKPVWGIDWAILLVAIFGLVILLLRAKKTNPYWWLIIAWLLVYCTYLSFSRGAIPRWEIPVIPIFVLLAASVVGKLKSILTSSKNTIFKHHLICISLVVILISRPAWHIAQFDLGISSNKVGDESSSSILKKNNCKRVYFNYSMEYSSLQEFIDSDCDCAVLNSHYWNDLETNGIPAAFEDTENNASFIGVSSMAVRNHIRQNWIMTGKSRSLFSTDWTFNPALPSVEDVFIKPK